MSTINIQIGEKNVPQVGTFENSEDVKFTTVEEAGCLNHFNRVQDCMTKNQDCDSLVKDFRECSYNSGPTDCFDYEQRFYYTIFFVLLPPLFWLFEFLTLTWEPTGLRKQIKV